MKFIWYYYLIINIFILFMMGWDKLCAIKGYYRIPEKVLLLGGVLSGGLGGLIGMFLFRHKIRKPYFWLIFIAALILHLWLIGYFIIK